MATYVSLPEVNRLYTIDKDINFLVEKNNELKRVNITAITDTLRYYTRIELDGSGALNSDEAIFRCYVYSNYDNGDAMQKPIYEYITQVKIIGDINQYGSYVDHITVKGKESGWKTELKNIYLNLKDSYYQTVLISNITVQGSLFEGECRQKGYYLDSYGGINFSGVPLRLSPSVSGEISEPT